MNNIKSYLLIVLLICVGCNKKTQSADKDQVFKPNQTTHIAIKPYHDISDELVQLVSKELEEFYHLKTVILPRGEMPDSCKNPYKKRYNANKILDYLKFEKPKDIPFILALTTKGIATKNDKYYEWGILGLGSRPGPVCVISTANMGKEEIKLKDRLIKVCLHEMGHNFGLPHCEYGDKRCLMRSANGTVRTVDEEEKFLCIKCVAYLQSKGFQVKNS
jgi:archaemetzincin